MNERSGVAIVLGGVALLLVGCGGTPAPAPPAQPAVRAAGAKEITLHVAGMVKRLNIF
jgi:hypothetical protein